MKTRAALLREMGIEGPYAQTRPVTITEVELDPPGPGEVLVRIKVAGLCHSDLSVINGDRPRALPIILGHESSAEVVETGEGVSDLHAGDHVVMVFVPSCGCCFPCMKGRPALCEPGAPANAKGTLLSGERRLRLGEEYLNHATGVSCFAEYAVVSRRSCVKVEADISHREAALFGCAVLTGAGAVINRARMQAGDTAAVVGLGGVGLSALLAAAASGARRLVAVDTLDAKLDMALDLGATHAFNATDPDLTAKVRECTCGGVDAALEFAGSARALEGAFAMTRRGGTTISGGLTNPGAVLNISPLTLVAEERTLRGSYLGSGVPARDIPRFLSLHRRGRLPVEKLMTHRIGLDEVNEGFDRLHEGAAIRQVIEFPG